VSTLRPKRELGNYSTPFDIPRHYHSHWISQSGKNYLIGGWSYRAQNNSVIATPSGVGDSKEFLLKKPIYGACAIQLKDKTIITGGALGAESLTSVSEYNEKGFIGWLPSLISGRRDHACGHYYDKNDLIYIVTGGVYWPLIMNSTERFDGKSFNRRI